MTFHELNLLRTEALKAELLKCCGSTAWINKMLPFFPMDDLVEMLEDAEEQWYACTTEDWKEAFKFHPKIGDTRSLAEKVVTGNDWASGEQSAINTASVEAVTELAELNKEYEKKFGYIFIVSATGKNAEEILDLLRQRLTNSPGDEIKIAAEEQNKITSIRLQKLIT